MTCRFQQLHVRCGPWLGVLVSLVVAAAAGCAGGRSTPAVAAAPSDPRMPNHGTLTAYLREHATFSRILTGPPTRSAIRADRVTQRVEYVLARNCTLAVNLYTSTADLESGAVRDERRIGWVVPIRSIDRGRVSARRKQNGSGLWTVALYPAEPGAFAFRQTVEFLRTLIPPDDTTAQTVRSEDWARFFTLDVANEDAARRIGEAFAASLPECELWYEDRPVPTRSFGTRDER